MSSKWDSQWEDKQRPSYKQTISKGDFCYDCHKSKRENLDEFGDGNESDSMVLRPPFRNFPVYLFASLPPPMILPSHDILALVFDTAWPAGRAEKSGVFSITVREKQILMVKLFFTMTCKTNISHRFVILCYLRGSNVSHPTHLGCIYIKHHQTVYFSCLDFSLLRFFFATGDTWTWQTRVTQTRHEDS